MSNKVSPKAKTEDIKNGPALPDFSNWSDEQIGFSPYWTPAPGKWTYARPIARDERDPEFIRYLFVALMPTPCRRGPGEDSPLKDNGENVTVAPGETFSMSVYYQLRDLFDFYLETGILDQANSGVRIEAIKEVPTKKSGQTVWQFKAQVDPKVRPLLDAKRAEIRQLQMADA